MPESSQSEQEAQPEVSSDASECVWTAQEISDWLRKYGGGLTYSNFGYGRIIDANFTKTHLTPNDIGKNSATTKKQRLTPYAISRATAARIKNNERPRYLIGNLITYFIVIERINDFQKAVIPDGYEPEDARWSKRVKEYLRRLPIKAFLAGFIIGFALAAVLMTRTH